MPVRKWLVALVGIVVVGAGTGCPPMNPAKPAKPANEPSVPAPALPKKVPPYVTNTVAQYAQLQGGGYLRVTGWGVVMGLGLKGSSEVPEHLKDYLIKIIRRDMGLGSSREELANVSPEQFLRDKDTAVVAVEGWIPGGATPGSRFDLFVRSMANDQTTSLDGGRLMMTELRLAVGGPETAGRGTVYAFAEGEIFVNPFIDPQKVENLSQLREGWVLGGGVVAPEAARVQKLQMRQASHEMARRIGQRILQRWPGRIKAAVPKNEYTINILVPDEFQREYPRFLRLLTHLPIYFGNEQYPEHAQEIARAMESPNAQHEELALVWEAMGRQAIPAVRKTYKSRVPRAVFYAARTGLQLDDSPAAQIMLEIAANPASPLRIQAIEELGRHPSVSAGALLADLLDDPNVLLRLAAYRAIIQRGGHPAVTSVDVGGRFMLDAVICKGPRMIYVTRTGQPRIAVFGGYDTPVSTPLYSTTPGGLVTVNAAAPGADLTVYRRTPITNRLSKPFTVPAKVVPLASTLGMPAKVNAAGNVMGLGLTYGQVVSTLYYLCQAGDIKAEFVPELAPREQAMLRGSPVTYRPDTP